MPQTPFVHDAVPFAFEHAARLPQVVPHADVRFKLVSQPSFAPPQSPYPALQLLMPHTPFVQDAVPAVVEHGTGEAHSPAAEQVSTAAPEQRFVVGRQLVHKLPMHDPDAQSPATEHPSPVPHRVEQLPPQSRPVSSPLRTPSLHAAVAQTLPVHLPLVGIVQSSSSPHRLPMPHRVHDPPQSSSVSSPFWTPSVQPGAMQLPVDVSHL
jgi:hypothetical protein